MLKDSLIQEVDLFLLRPLMVSKYQALIMHHLTAALADQKAGKDARLNLMKGVVHGDIHAWIGVSGQENERRIVGMIFTTITMDPFLGIRRLLIYGLHMKEQLAPVAIGECLQSLADYGKKRGCNIMEAHTRVRGITILLERNGWQNGQSVLTKEL